MCAEGQSGELARSSVTDGVRGQSGELARSLGTDCGGLLSEEGRVEKWPGHQALMV